MKTLKLAALAIFAALAVQAAAINATTNYLTGYVSVTQGWSTAENSGLVVGTAYVCIPFATLTNSSMPVLTAANASHTGTVSDVRALLFSINDKAYTTYAATASTNRPENATVSRNITVSETYFNASHALQTKWTFNATLTP